MSTDGSNFEQPVNPSADTQPQPTVEQQQSRRKFLRTAVVSGVAVATVGATAGVAAASSNTHTGILSKLGVHLGTGSGCLGDPCFTGTNQAALENLNGSFNVHSGGNASPGDFYLWFTFPNLAPGTYTITVSPDPGASPFAYTGSQSVKLFELAAGSAAGCPTVFPTSTKTEFVDTMGDLQPYKINGPSNSDLQLAIHFHWGGSTITSDQHYSFVATLSSNGSAQCTATMNLTAHSVK